MWQVLLDAFQRELEDAQLAASNQWKAVIRQPCVEGSTMINLSSHKDLKEQKPSRRSWIQTFEAGERALRSFDVWLGDSLYHSCTKTLFWHTFLVRSLWLHEAGDWNLSSLRLIPGCYFPLPVRHGVSSNGSYCGEAFELKTEAVLELRPSHMPSMRAPSMPCEISDTVQVLTFKVI